MVLGLFPRIPTPSKPRRTLFATKQQIGKVDAQGLPEFVIHKIEYKEDPATKTLFESLQAKPHFDILKAVAGKYPGVAEILKSKAGRQLLQCGVIDFLIIANRDDSL